MMINVKMKEKTSEKHEILGDFFLKKTGFFEKKTGF